MSVAEPILGTALTGAARAFYDACVELIAMGFHVLPCRTDKSPFTLNGYKDATTDLKEVYFWAQEFPDAQPAIACFQSDLVVIDVDYEGLWTDFLVDQGYTLPETLTVRTPSGGRHHYFRAPPGLDFAGKPCTGVDIKHKGYVLAPPAQAFSIRSGQNGPYKWDNPGTPIAPVPDWPELHAKRASTAVATRRPVDAAASTGEIGELLSHIDPDLPYDQWRNVIMNIHEATQGSQEGLQIADDWSSQGAKYRQGDVTKRWPGFTLGKTSGMPVLARMAKSHGADVGAIGRRHKSGPGTILTREAGGFDFSKLDLTNVVPFRCDEYELAMLHLKREEARASWSKAAGVAEGAEGQAAGHEATGAVELGVTTSTKGEEAKTAGYEEHPGATLEPIPEVLKARLEKLRASMIAGPDARPVLNSDYLIKNWLGTGTTSVLFGPSNAGKSFVALNIANCVAEGRDWNGYKVRGGPVFYFAAEGGRAFMNRLCALPDGASSNLHLVAASIDLHSDDFDTAAILLLIEAQTKESGQPALVVFDTLARTMAGGDENSGPDIARVIRRMDTIRAESGAHVMLVHHTGKDVERGARGHSSLRGAVDTEIELKRSGEDRFIEATKQRDMETGKTLSFRLVRVEIGVDEDGDASTSCHVEFFDTGPGGRTVPQLSKNQKAVLKSLKADIAAHGAPIPVVSEEPASEKFGVNRDAFVDRAAAKWDSKTPKQRKRAVTEALSGLENRGLVAGDGDHVWVND